MKYRYLSHILDKEVPIYGGSVSIDIKRVRSIANGDSANIYQFSIENHWGTHIDAPNHFFEKGEKISGYPASSCFFKLPEVIQITLTPSEILNCGKWIEDINPQSDILLFQSGWTKFRGEKVYAFNNPEIHPDAGFYLRKNYPNLRAIGIDWISISSYQNRSLGRKSHQAFLNPEWKNNPILIIEDMDLSFDLATLREVVVSPLRVEGIDSAPCTVIGIFND